MLRTRVLTAAVLIPITIGLAYLGGLPFLALVGLMISLAEIEFHRLMIQGNFRPTLAFGLGMVWVFLLDAQFPAWELLKPGLALVLLASLAWQMYHRQGLPVVNWALTMTSGLYLGACGASMVKLRELADGFWWILMVLSATVGADSAAYFIGRAWGRHKMTPSLSPGKTWEGYTAGIVAGALTPMLIALLWQASGGRANDIVQSLAIGLPVAALAPLGDLAISMVKRQVGAKDSGNIIPGHGGALDRLDSLLWAAVIGYYCTLWFVA